MQGYKPLILYCMCWVLQCDQQLCIGQWYFCSETVCIKQSHYRPWQTLRVPGGWGSQILRQSAYEGGNVVSPTHRSPLPQEIFLVLITIRSWVDPRAIMRPEGLCQWKVPVALSGIDPATFRFVAQCLNHWWRSVIWDYIRTVCVCGTQCSCNCGDICYMPWQHVHSPH
jgi:hypothetical protein